MKNTRRSSPLDKFVSLLETVSSFVEVPLLGTFLEIVEALKYARAALIVTYRRYGGISMHAILAYVAILLCETSLLDGLLPRWMLACVRFLRAVIPMVRKAINSQVRSAPLLALAA